MKRKTYLKKITKLSTEKGQTLVMLLIFMLISVTVTAASVGMILNSAVSTDKVYQGSNAFTIAEGGAETAMIKLLRDSSYSGETLDIGNGQAIVTVTGNDPKIIRSVGTYRNFSRTIQVTVTNSNNILTVTSWKEL